MILAIDPGNIESAYVFLGESKTNLYKHLEFDKVENDKLMGIIDQKHEFIDEVVIEMITGYNMSVGQTVFETCVWIGRFIEKLECFGIKTTRVSRKEVKMNLCGSMRAKDKNIIEALVDRFSPNDTRNHGKGTKKEPGYFYNFKADIWQAYAVGITYLDKKVRNDDKCM